MNRHTAWTLLIALILASSIGMASAVFTDVPSYWCGDVTINGSAAPNGTMVSGWIDDVEKANESITGGKYFIEVVGNTGDTIVLKIHDAEVETVPFETGTHPKDLSLTDLQVNTSAQPDALPASTTTTFVLINWTANPGSDTTGLSNYELLRATGAVGPFASINVTSDTTQTTYNDTGLSNGFTYYYRLRTYDKVGNVGNATDVNTTIDTGAPVDTTPPVPTGLLNTTGNYWVNYTWTAGAGIVTDGYNVSMNGTWYNRTGTSLNSSVGAGNWSNITVWAWNKTGSGNMSATNASDTVQAPAAPVDTTPPVPTGLLNTTGNYWVNYTWTAGAGIVTDGYNVSMNGTWYNRTGTSLNSSVGAGNWSNITVWAWNKTGSGNMSATNASDTVQAPAAPVDTTPPVPTGLLNTTGNYWVNYTWTAGAGIVTDGYNVSMNGTWYNRTGTSLNSSVGAGNWSNITVWAWNKTGSGNMSATNESDTVQAPAAATYIPEDPVTLLNSTGNYWVNYTWSDGAPLGNVTDSYNVSMNDTWTNDTTATFMNVSVGSGGWANITVFAFNSSGAGTLSAGSVSDTVQAPAAATYIPEDPVTLLNSTGNYWVNYTWSDGAPLGNVTDSYNVSMNDTWTNDTTATFMNVSVGSGGWANITVFAFNSSGAGTLSAGSVSDTVQAPAAATYIPEDPVTLLNSTGNYWVNYTWSDGAPLGNVTDSYNVSMNDTWTNDTTATFMNVSVGSGGWANITVFAFNSSGAGTLSAGSVSDTVQAPAAPADTTPPVPTGLLNTTGNYWVNYTWTVGTGIVTDGYNVSMNGTWYNRTGTSLNSSVGAGNWSNITVWAWNKTGSGNMSATNASDTVQAPAAPVDTTPPVPTSLLNTTGNYWVNYTWTAGAGIVTDSYYVKMNDTWTNGTTATFMNASVGSGGWANITVFAFNSSGAGTLSAGSVSDTVQAPAALAGAPNITSWDNNKTNNDSLTITINESESVRFNATANQTIDTWHWYNNGTDQLSNFDNYTTSWSVNGTNTISVNATNANGTSNTKMWTITVNDIRPPAPVTGLVNDTPAATMVNLSWTANTEADLVGYQVYWNGTLLGSTANAYYNATDLLSSTAYEFNVSAYDDNGLEGENASIVVTTAVGPFHHIDVMPTSWTMNDNESRNFTATGRDQNDGKISGLVFAWSRSDAYIGSFTEINDTTTNFTAEHVGITYLTASNGSVTSGQIQVTVNAPTNNTTVSGGNATATSGDSTAIVKLDNESVNGTITIKELGDPLNSTTANGSTDGLGTGVELIKGVNITASANVTGALANDTNRTSWIHIKIEYNESRLGTIDENTLFIYKYVNGSGWVKLVSGSNNCTANGRNTTANYIWANVTHLCDFGVGGSAHAGSSGRGGGGGSGGTYPPGWFGTPTPTVTATKAPTATTTATAAPPGEHVTPAPTKKTAASKATAPTAEGTTAGDAKKSAPGFTAVFAIAGMLALAYVMMRRRG